EADGQAVGVDDIDPAAAVDVAGDRRPLAERDPGAQADQNCRGGRPALPDRARPGERPDPALDLRGDVDSGRGQARGDVAEALDRAAALGAALRVPALLRARVARADGVEAQEVQVFVHGAP